MLTVTTIGYISNTLLTLSTTFRLHYSNINANIMV